MNNCLWLEWLGVNVDYIVIIIFAITILGTIEYYQFWYYLSKRYPATLLWLKRGSFIGKGLTIGFNPKLSLSLLYQDSKAFIEQYKDYDFIEEYSSLIMDRRFLFRKRFLLVVGILILLVFLLLLIHQLLGSIEMKDGFISIKRSI